MRKYVRARNAEEAIKLSRKLPVVEVNEMQDKPDVQNAGPGAPCVGFTIPMDDEE